MSEQALIEWLVSTRTGVEVLWGELAQRLVASGIPLWRAVTSVPTKHPEVYVRNIIWSAERGTEMNVRDHGLVESARYKDSPVALIHQGQGSLRCRLTGPDADLRFPICRDLAAEGGTDYLVVSLVLGDVRTFASWATREPNGFTDGQLRSLHAIESALELRLELEAAQYAMRSLLDVYLGPNAARRVLAGGFKRGRGESIRAAIWFCDMRGFTAMSDAQPAAQVVATLDRFFEAVAAPIAAHGGEILKFIGDGALAIFPMAERDPRAVCADAIAAAREALQGVAALNADRNEPIGVGLALHVGDVLYGNIGAHERLDFTVIGSAVNEASRIEALTKTVGSPVLLSRAFVDAWQSEEVRAAGVHSLRGVSEPQELFTISEL